MSLHIQGSLFLRSITVFLLGLSGCNDSTGSPSAAAGNSPIGPSGGSSSTTSQSGGSATTNSNGAPDVGGSSNATGGRGVDTSNSNTSSSNTGGTSVGSGGSTATTTGGSTSNPDAAATISDWMNSCLPYGNPTGANRTQIIDAIIGACTQFGPPPEKNSGWKEEYCWAHLLGSILKESSYNVTSINEPGSDPTVGLTQIRFSSTVCDFYTGGPRARLEAMGCQFPSDFADHASEQCSAAFWKSGGGDSAHTTWMQTPSCNIGLGAWYYYVYSTGGGDTSKTNYLYQICSGAGKGANLATGLMSHLRGPSNQWASIPDMNSVPSAGTDYFNAIAKVMDCALGSVSGTHPIFMPLVPNTTQYCK